MRRHREYRAAATPMLMAVVVLMLAVYLSFK